MDNIKIFTDKQLGNYADVMIWGLKKAKKKELKKNSFIEVKYQLPGLALAEVIHEKLLDQGFIPVLKPLMTPKMERDFYSKAADSQIESITPGQLEYVSNISGTISIIAPSSLDHLLDVDSDKISLFSKSRADLRKILNQRENHGDYSWTLCIYPTKVLADAADLSLEEYAGEISNSCFLDEDNPVEKWKGLADKCDDLKEKLLKLEIDKFRIKSENTDLIIKNGDKRKWLGISGRNIPSFELFISPDWRGTNGIFYANQPSYKSGNIVEGIRVEFKDGNIVSASAKKGEDYLLKTLETDEGAKRVGEFSMTDKKFSRINSFMANTLFDENYGGEFGNNHIALGASYSNSFSGSPDEFTPDAKKALGFNESAIHWDIVNTEKKTITAFLRSGEEIILYEDGEFKI